MERLGEEKEKKGEKKEHVHHCYLSLKHKRQDQIYSSDVWDHEFVVFFSLQTNQNNCSNKKNGGIYDSDFTAVELDLLESGHPRKNLKEKSLFCIRCD